MKSLQGRVALLAGADGTGGLCPAIAEALRVAGAEVKQAGDEELGDAKQVEALVQRMAREYGRLDVLVNVPGAAWGSNTVEDYAPELWMKTVQEVLYRSFLLAKYCLPVMARQNSGSIINVGSIAAIRCQRMNSAYGAAMAGLIHFTKDMAAEYGPRGIRANALLPGTLQTESLQEDLGDMAALLGMSESEVSSLSAEAAPLQRLGQPQDIAALVVFLCGDAASYLTGLAIPVAGGKELC